MADPTLDQVPGTPSSGPAPASVAPAPSPSPSPVATEPAVPVQADQPAVPAASPTAPTGDAADPSAPKPDATAKADDGLGPTLLEEFDASKKPAAAPVDPAAPKPADAKPVDPAKPADPAAAAAAPAAGAPVALPPVDYFKDVAIPETIKIADDQRTELAGALDLIRGGNASEGMGKLVSLHEKAMQSYAEQVVKDQWSSFRKTNEDWRTQVMADPLLGGAGHKTAMAAVARMRDMAVSNHKPGTPEHEADRRSFDDFLKSTGAGNHPAFLRMMHNFSRAFDEPAMPPADIRVPKDIGRAPGDRRSRMYPSMNARS
jgi:hypothetical protein